MKPREMNVGGTVSVLVNGESRTIPAGCSVEGLLELLGVERRRIAVAVNRNVVPRSTYAAHHLDGDDRIEILEAVGGG